MLPRKKPAVLVLFLAFLGLSAVNSVGAQVFDLDKGRVALTRLDGLWRFHPGDDAHWAYPSFDDSSWLLLRSDRGWNSQGYPGMSGFGWYRFSIRIPERTQPLALYFPRMMTSYEVYADGHRLGAFGGMPPYRKLLTGRPPLYVLPGVGSPAEKTVIIAIRVWHWPFWAHYYGGGPQSAGYVGEISSIDRMRRDDFPGNPWSWAPPLFSATMCLIGGLFSLGFAWQHRREREYLWFGVWLLFKAYFDGLASFANFVAINIDFREISRAMAEAGGILASLAFYSHLLRGRKDWLFWLSVIAALTRPLPFTLAMLGVLTQTQVNTCNFATLLPSVAWIVILVTARAWRSIPDARLLLAPTLLQEGVIVAGIISFEAFALGLTHGSSSANRFITLTVRPFVDVIFLSAMLAILVGRFTRTRRHEEHLAGELQAARIVQQILIPDEIPAIPGFTIQSCYIPASEVGGDFFQVISLPGGGVLAAIGDVSGKGMPAAMTVSLLVGTLRTLVDYSQSPGEILSAMNQRMIGRTKGGFTTCLILRVCPNGAMTIASAGHQMPYVDGSEIAGDTGLPLGILADTPYVETAGRLRECAQLTLITDGVIEARDKSGELFGFDRTTAISAQSAEQIAAHAQQFGQEDDITVVTLTRESPAGSTAVCLAEPEAATSPA